MNRGWLKTIGCKLKKVLNEINFSIQYKLPQLQYIYYNDPFKADLGVQKQTQ